MNAWRGTFVLLPFAMRRLAPTWLWAALLLLVVLLAWLRPGDPGPLALVDPLQRAALVRGSSFLILALASGCGLSSVALSQGARWSTRERDFLLARAAEAAPLALASALALAAAAALALVLCALGAELAARGPALPGVRVLRSLPAPPLVLLPGQAAERWSVADPRSRLAAGQSVQLALLAAQARAQPHAAFEPAGAAGDATRRTSVELALRWRGASAALSASVPGTGALRLQLPPPAAPDTGESVLELELRRSGAGPALALDPASVLLLAPIGDARSSSLYFSLAAWPFLGALLCFALACGSCLGRALGALALAALCLPALLAAAVPPWPGAELPAALAQLERGLAPGAPPAEVLLFALLLALLSTALLWRRVSP